MRKIGYLLVLSLVLLVFPITSRGLEPTDCFDYYKFQDGLVFMDFQPEKTSYSAGDRVYFEYRLINNMDWPIVEGRERVQIFVINKGIEHLIDEFFVSENVNLRRGSTLRRTFYWEIPENSLSGEYVAKIYFIVGNSFNLAGLSFVPYGPPGAPGDLATFSVEGTDDFLYFDQDRTYLNDERYDFGAFIPSVNNSAKIRTQLVNDGSAKEISVKFEVFEWDDLTQKIVHKEEAVIPLGENSKKDLEYLIEDLTPNAYEAVFTAESEDKKAMLKIRFAVPGPKPRFLYAGLTDFPLEPNREYKVFICTSNSADHMSYSSGDLSVTLEDESGDIIFEENLKNESVAPVPKGYQSTFSPNKKVVKGTLKLELRGSKGEVVDSARLEYDYARFLNINAQLKLEVEQISVLQGENLDYSLEYSDGSIPLTGDVLAYVIGPDENIKYREQTSINGIKTGTVKALFEPGEYIFRARELKRDLVVSETFTVNEKGATSTATEESRGIPTYVYLAAVIIVIGLVIGWWFRR